MDEKGMKWSVTTFVTLFYNIVNMIYILLIKIYQTKDKFYKKNIIKNC